VSKNATRIFFVLILGLALRLSAQSFTIPGNIRGWFDTGIDVPAGTRIILAASGRVDVGAGWGIHGPEGTTAFADVPGYPAATQSRYGLVARLTESRTNGNDELHNDYAYAQYREFCSGGAGHLWFAINDDRPENNEGGFNVTVTRGKCTATVGTAPLPLTGQRGTFRVRLNGFRVHRQTWDDALNSDGAGDEIYFVHHATMVDVTGARPAPLAQNWGGFTSAFGDSGHQNVIAAGDASGNGGLRTGNAFPASFPERGGSASTGPALFWGELVQGQTGAVLVTAVFESDHNEDLRARYGRSMHEARTALESSLSALIRGAALRSAAAIVRTGDGLGLGALRSALSHGASFTGESVDRPIGMTRRIGGNGFTFVPQGLVLTYEAADSITRGDLFGKGRGIVEIRYTDVEQLKGDYSLYFLVERATP
jgi:hypothetical protein